MADADRPAAASPRPLTVPAVPQTQEFWVILTTFLSRLYTSPLVTATAARGFCPAGGTAVLLCSDVRVISGAGRVSLLRHSRPCPSDPPRPALWMPFAPSPADVTSCGLNEVALGIPVPKYWSALMARVVGEGPASDMCLSGTMAPAHRCLELGMAQAAVPCALVVAEAERRVRDLLRHPDQGRRATKHLMRADFGAAWRDFAEAEADFGWDQLSQPAAIASLRAVFERLGSGKARAWRPVPSHGLTRPLACAWATRSLCGSDIAETQGAAAGGGRRGRARTDVTRPPRARLGLCVHVPSPL